MTRSISTVRNGTLHERTEDASSTNVLAVESAGWFAWLESHHSFRFEHPTSPFTARKEQRSGGRYWYAYRHQGGRLRTAYLGRSAELSMTRLNTIAVALGETGEKTAPQAAAEGHAQNSHAPPASQLAYDFAHEPISQHSLLQPLTPLVGREQEVAAAVTFLQHSEVHLVSLVGAAGVGKTRLALQVATDLQEHFVDGVFFVALAPLRNAELVLPTVARTQGLRTRGSQSFLDLLKAHLREKRCLLLLDNCEQVASAAPQLVELLQACPFVKMLVTSRAVLHVRGEQEFLVRPLALPDLTLEQNSVLLSQVAAVQLFLQRAQAVEPTFQLTQGNARVIAEICVRLDGLPLAIELAAMHLKLLSPQQLLVRLEHRLQLLTGGPADLPARQQTLRTTLEWSYELLYETEQRLFRRLAVFVGGCTLEAVEALSSAFGESAEQVLKSVRVLLDNQLLSQQIQREGQSRLLMLETLREYGLERLAISEETLATQRAHAIYYLAHAEEGVSKEFRTELELERLEREHDNLRAALSWFLEQNEHGSALRLSIALWGLWIRGHVSEGSHWFELALSTSTGVAPYLRAKGWYISASLAYYGGDTSRSEVLCQASLKEYRALGDKRGLALALNGLAHNARTRGNYAALQALCAESFPVLQALGDRWRVAETLYLLAFGASAQGDSERARALAEESLTICREVGDIRGIADALHAVGFFASRQGDHAAARTFYKESLTIAQRLDEAWISVLSLMGWGEVALAQGQLTWAAQLWGAAEALRAMHGLVSIPDAERVSYERSAAAARARRGEEAFAAAWEQGQRMTLQHILAIEDEGALLRPPDTQSPRIFPAHPFSEELTPRELDVLRLLAQGLTSAQIAERLVIGVVTVNFHVRSLYSKLGVTSRAAATRYALEYHLV